jgi:hypothetical protein
MRGAELEDVPVKHHVQAVEICARHRHLMAEPPGPITPTMLPVAVIESSSALLVGTRTVTTIMSPVSAMP